ncbi:hypothetical protein MKX01_040697, partial [Papaver californicum]
LHGVISKKLILKFEPLLCEVGTYFLSKLNSAPEKKVFRPARNEFRAFFSWNTVTNHYIKINRPNGQHSKICDLTLQNLKHKGWPRLNL